MFCFTHASHFHVACFISICNEDHSKNIIKMNKMSYFFSLSNLSSLSNFRDKRNSESQHNFEYFDRNISYKDYLT